MPADFDRMVSYLPRSSSAKSSAVRLPDATVMNAAIDWWMPSTRSAWA